MFGRGKKARNKAIAVIGVIVLVALLGVAYKAGYLAELGLAQAYYNEVENYKGYTIKMRWVSGCNSCGNAYYVKGYGNGKGDPRWGNVQGARDYIDDVLVPQTTPTPIATSKSEGVEALLNTVERASPTETPSSKVEETIRYECPEGYEPNKDNTACTKPKTSLPGFEAFFAIAGIVTVAYIVLKSERKKR